MFFSYVKIACRNLWRNKGFSAINIFGLTLGIATCLLILLYVQHELSYDRFNKNANRIVRVVFRAKVQGQQLREANVFPPVAKTLLANYPEVEAACRLSNAGTTLLAYGDQAFLEKSLVFADPDVFRIFSFPLQRGDAATALSRPNSIVVTRVAAAKYFGKADPVGKIIEDKTHGIRYTVTGLMDAIPENAHFHFDLFASMANNPDAASASWMSSGYFTYLLLKKGTDAATLESAFPGMLNRYMGPQILQAMNLSLADFTKNGNQIGLYLQPLADIHLHSDFTNDFEPYGDIRYIYIFSAIALFMLLIACINFMNLSTAGAARRAREVGIRKVMGSGRPQLVAQFLAESILIALAALALSVFLVKAVLPFFNELSGRSLQFNSKEQVWLLPALLAIGIVTGLFAGSYPAFFLSAMDPVTVLKGRFTAGKKSRVLRSGLVVFQFSISIVLMICTAVVYRQLSYIQHKKLGYVKDQVLVLPAWQLGSKSAVLRDQLHADPRVLRISNSDFLPAGPSNSNNFFIYTGEVSAQIKSLRYEVDENYIPTLGMQLAAGRNFEADMPTDSTALIVSETAAAALGLGNGQAAIGKMVLHSNDGITERFRVIGVVKDFHFKSLHEKIAPLVMTLTQNSGTLILKTAAINTGALLPSIKAEWTALDPAIPFSYSFLDDRFAATYRAEENTGKLLAVLAGLTIFVACLGLFGLATFTARQRFKEIGIRKVLGASVGGIVQLLSAEFLRLVLLALVIGAPVAWWTMHTWLEDFEYRITIPWWIFLWAAAAAALIAICTVGLQALRAALANPVNSLRNE